MTLANNVGTGYRSLLIKGFVPCPVSCGRARRPARIASAAGHGRPDSRRGRRQFHLVGISFDA